MRAEVTAPPQSESLEEAISSGGIEVVVVDDPAALATYAELVQVLGRGESAAIALAAHRRWILAMDERGRARREAERHLGAGRIVTTPGILVGCIQHGVLEVADADAIKGVLAANRFVMAFRSFADVLPPGGAA